MEMNLGTKIGAVMVALGLSGIVGSGIEGVYSNVQAKSCLIRDDTACYELYKDRRDLAVAGLALTFGMTVAGAIIIRYSQRNEEE